MPTPGERKALLFIAGVALLGGAVRLLGAGAERPLPAEDLKGLDAQLAAADSASSSERARKRNARGGGGRRPPREKTPRPARADGDARRTARAPTITPSLAPPLSRSKPTADPPIDLDRATVEEIDVLPGIGPSLARRIVAWRDSAGGIGGLEALDCVPGVGPALLRKVAARVTFSAGRRPSCVGSPAPAGRRTRRPR